MNMRTGFVHTAMLLGLVGAALPVVIHLLARHRTPVIDWAAMRFLELSPRARRRLDLNDRLLLLTRVLLCAIMALALARPYSARSQAGTSRDHALIVIVDGSASMDRRCVGLEGETPRHRASQIARRLAARQQPGEPVTLLASDHEVHVHDLERDDIPAPPRTTSDLPAALDEALGRIERAGHRGKYADVDVIILSDGQRAAWRPDDRGAWERLAERRRRGCPDARFWALDLGGAPPAPPASTTPRLGR